MCQERQPAAPAQTRRTSAADRGNRDDLPRSAGRSVDHFTTQIALSVSRSCFIVMARKASRTTPNLESQPLRGADFERAHSSVVLGEDVRDRRRGFTIVELLIVVVVIAILAAITIVAYNGITNRARAAAASSAAQQAAEKVAVFAIANSDQYPATLADAGVPNGSVTFQYGVDNTTTPRTFCVIATSNNVSYFASSTSAVPVAGACDGHGLNGEPTMTNLVLNPSVEINTMNWDYRWYGTGGGDGTNERPTSGGIRGAAFLRKTWTATGAGQDNGFSTNSSPSRLQVQGGTQYYVAASMRTNRSGFTPYIWVCWYDSSGFSCTAATARRQTLFKRFLQTCGPQ